MQSRREASHTDPVNGQNSFGITLVSRQIGRQDDAVPLGAASVAAALLGTTGLSGCHVELVESFPDEPVRDLADRIARSAPDAVGFSLYAWNRSDLAATARRVRSLLPEGLFFAGGPEASAAPDGLLAGEGGYFDFLVNGEGEEAVPAALEALLSGTDLSGIPGIVLSSNDSVPRVAVADLSGLPSPWAPGLLGSARREGALWELSRGCPYACSYCFEGRGERRVRRFSEARLDSELETFYALGVRSVFVLDPVFTAQRDRAAGTLDSLIRRAELAEARDEAPVHWHFEARAEQLDRGLARRFAELGCSLQIGLQTADPEVARGVGRSFDRRVFEDKIGILNEEGVAFGLDLIYGLPGDTLRGFLVSLDFALSLYPNNLDIFPLAVLPGTRLHDEAADLGLRWAAEPPYLVQSTPSFPAEDLARASGIASAAEEFYDRGRAVAWFNQVLYPLGMKPSAFLSGFADFLTSDHGAPAGPRSRRSAGGRAGGSDPVPDPVAVERRQLAYLDALYGRAGLDHLLPALWDIVRFHGAWGRAVAEGLETVVDFTYDPEDVSAATGVDLDSFAAAATPRPTRARVVPGPDGVPEILLP